MKSTIATLALLLAAVPGFAGNYVINEDFTNGIPADYVLKDLDGMKIAENCFTKTYMPVTTWYAQLAPTDDLNRNGIAAAMSSSRRSDSQMATDNWMILPAVKIEEGARIDWLAKSIHSIMHEDYKVMISEGSEDPADFKPLLEVNEENYNWTRHTLELGEYVGKTVRIAFVHCSKAKFLLAVRDIKVGVPDAIDLAVTNNTRHFFAVDELKTVKGTITNFGLPVEIASIQARTGSMTVSQRFSPAETLAGGETLDFDMNVMAELNSRVDYSLYAILADGTEVALGEPSSLFCSYFPRRIMLEKFSSMTCNNCPQPNARIKMLKERFGSELIVSEGHRNISQYNLDPFAYVPYTGFITNYPTVLINRAVKVPGNNVEISDEVMTEPVEAGIDLKLVKNDNGTYSVTSTTQFAHDTDNANGFYRLGYLLNVKSYFLPGAYRSYQYWSPLGLSTSLSYGEFAYMPSNVPNTVMGFSDVTIGTPDAVIGQEGSIPTEIKSFEPMEHTYTFEVPELLPDAENLRDKDVPASEFAVNPDDVEVVVFVIEAKEQKVLNIASIDIKDAETTGITATVAESAISMRYADGSLLISLPSDAEWSAEVYGLDGSKYIDCRGTGNHAEINCGLEPGVYMARASQGAGFKTIKFVVR